MMRKTSVVLLSAVTGAALTLFITQPRAVLMGSSARAATSDTYRQLNLFGDVFERVRSDYVEKPDDSKLVVDGAVTTWPVVGVPPWVYAQIKIGSVRLDHVTAMSPAASLALLPVLSPTRQPLGSPARNRLSPVLQPTIQAVRRSREFSDSTFPNMRLRRLPAMAAGVVVSCGSPGGERFSSGSL